MKTYKLIVSKDAPNARDCVWLKPIGSGFTLYFLDGGRYVPLQLVDDNNTSSTTDDTPSAPADIKSELIGSVQDEGTANTINGAKSYADGVGDTLMGEASDDKTAMTLYGLKAYIDDQIASLG